MTKAHLGIKNVPRLFKKRGKENPQDPNAKLLETETLSDKVEERVTAGTSHGVHFIPEVTISVDDGATVDRVSKDPVSGFGVEQRRRNARSAAHQGVGCGAVWHDHVFPGIRRSRSGRDRAGSRQARPLSDRVQRPVLHQLEHRKGGHDYEGADGIIAFLPGQQVKVITIKLIDDDSNWDAQREFRVHLSDPVDCDLGRHLHKTRVMLIDSGPFPSKHVDDGTSNRRKMWEYWRMNLKSPGMKRKAIKAAAGSG